MSTNEFNNFRQIIKNNGYRVTAARANTFRLLISPEPQTVGEILARAKGVVDRVSVYRNLKLFEKLGIVHRIYIGWKYKLELSEKFMTHHHHLSCLDCGKIIDIDVERDIGKLVENIAGELGFTPRRHQFEVDGYCKECKNTKPTKTT